MVVCSDVARARAALTERLARDAPPGLTADPLVARLTSSYPVQPPEQGGGGGSVQRWRLLHAVAAHL